jgi:hypothetical protein
VQFVLITRPELADTNEALLHACARRTIACVTVVAGGGSSAPLLPAPVPRLLYRASSDVASCLLEALLATPAAVALHDPHFPAAFAGMRMRQAGVPMARTVYVAAADEAQRAAQVQWLGGWPVVVKRPGLEGGAGISLAHSLADLDRQLQGLAAPPALEAFVPHARCWRLTVLGGRVLAASARAAAEGDFRSNAPGSRRLADAIAPAAAQAAAVAAVQALRLEFGGVDVMEGLDGRPWVAEVNFPCFFADETPQYGLPEEAGPADAGAGIAAHAGGTATSTVADHLVHYLIAKHLIAKHLIAKHLLS